MSIDNQIIDFMKKPSYLPMKQHELAAALGITDKGERRSLRHQLYTLEDQGTIVRLRKNRWSLPNKENRMIGSVKMLPKGGAVIISDDPEIEEVFVGARNMGLAYPNDLVEVERYHSEYGERNASSSSSGRRGEGRVTAVIERRMLEVVGTLKKARYHYFVTADNPNFPHSVRVTECEHIDKNHKVLVRLDPWTDPYQTITGTIIEDLGEASAPGVDVDSMLRAAGVEEAFPSRVIAEAEAIPNTIPESMLEGRRDLRKEVIFTIDPDTARDFDDAISLEPHPNGGWRLGVHIADVSAYVKPGSALDTEGYKRGNSIYLVDRVVMMLPTELTTQICSLNPNEDHLTHSAYIHLSDEGERLGYETFPAIIHSQCRMTYKQVQKHIDGEEGHQIPGFIQERLNKLYPLIRTVRKNRIRQGSLEINTPDVEIKLNERGEVDSMTPRSAAKEAYQLIEDCMLLANRAVAEKLMGADRPALYRIHEEPDEEQWNKMAMELNALGIPILPRSREELNEAFALAEGTPTEYTALLAILRNFKRAEYTARQVGHFGLAFEDYTHFTSPIRRYPDLVVHRLLKAIEKNSPPTLSKENIEEIASHCTETEKKADELEKKSTEKKRLNYFNQLLKAGKNSTFNGFIVGIKKRGMVIELPDSLQRGMVAFASIKSEWLEADDSLLEVTNREGTTRYRLGDPLEVMIAKVDVERALLDFMIPGEPQKKTRQGRKPRVEPDLRSGKAKPRGKNGRRRRRK